MRSALLFGLCMEAERKALETRVQFASVQLRVSEDYKAQLQVAPPSTGTRLRKALVEGYGSAVESVLNFVLFLLEAGPTLLLWAAVLFWPARYAWRRFRRLSRRHASLSGSVLTRCPRHQGVPRRLPKAVGESPRASEKP